LLNIWESQTSSQLELQLTDLPNAMDKFASQRIRYAAKRFQAYRIPLGPIPRLDRFQSSVTIRNLCKSISLPVRHLCQWLDQVRSDRLRSWHELIMPPSIDVDRTIRLRTGLDSNLAVLLGLGGQTGAKGGTFIARVFASGCSVTPEWASGWVGVPLEFLVVPGRAKKSVIHIDLQGSVGESVLLRVPLQDLGVCDEEVDPRRDEQPGPADNKRAMA
jgi:hypothetical protein